MKYYLIAGVLLLASCAKQQIDYQKYVNPLIGTDIRVVEGKDKNSTEERGQNMPAVGVPHGMTNWVAQTQASEKKCYPPYYYYQHAIQGFRASHWMNGSCTQDYGSVTIMPLTGKLEIDPEKRASAFKHTNEIATPSFYSVLLDDYDIQVEMTGLSRSGILSFDYQKAGDRYIIIEPNSDEGEGYIEIDYQKKEIRGHNPVHRIYQGYGQPAGFSGHFVIQLDADIEQFGVWVGDSIIDKVNKIQGLKNKVGAWVKLNPSSSNKVLAKIGTSFTSIENARKNLETEIESWNFSTVRNQSSDTWNNALGQIAVTGNNESDKVRFYTALYNAHFLPRTFSDADGSYPAFDGNQKTMKAEGFTYYCDFSMWDTFRAVHPLFSILNPTRNGDMAHSLILKGQQGGWLPIFPAWNSYTAAMIGDHCVSMLGDAIIKDTPGFDYEEAYSLMRKNAFEINQDHQSYINGKGRRAMDSYLKYNYIPLEDEVLDAFHKREQVSRTLEYAYDDFVLSQVAHKLGKTEDYNILKERAKNYKNVIDPETGFARGRNADGTWISPFDHTQFVSYICEGTPYHYTWYVPHDIEGLVNIIGKDRAIGYLDTFFEGGYYWHGNEPCHHVAYLFAYLGQPWKTQKWVHDIINKEYFNSSDGLSGNDDAGQMSSWLVFSMMGFYPVCPGMPYYVIGSPTFENVEISLENGKRFVIEAKDVSDSNIYIQSATLNGESHDKSYILHSDIMTGGVLSFQMGNTPNKQWSSSSESVPHSFGMK